MKKCQLIFIAFLCVSPIPRQTLQASAQTSKHSQHKRRSQDKPAASPAVVDSPIEAAPADPHGGKTGTEDKDQKVAVVSIPTISVAETPKNFWFQVLTWGPWFFNFFLVLVGIAQVVLLKRTWEKVSAQEQRMAEQLSAMEIQASAYVNAERARMTMLLEEVGRSFVIDAKNTGKAMAEVIYARGISQTLPYGQELPAIPPYLDEPEREGKFTEWITPDERIQMFNNDWNYGVMADMSDLKLCKAIRDKEISLWVYGRIVYADGISPIQRETRFCYKAIVSGEADFVETGIEMAGPPEYRKIT